MYVPLPARYQDTPTARRWRLHENSSAIDSVHAPSVLDSPMARPAPNCTKDAIKHLHKLADALHAKQVDTLSDSPAPPVIAVVGAGASASANLPVGTTMRSEITTRLFQSRLADVMGKQLLRNFDRGLREPWEQTLHRISLFELAAAMTEVASLQTLLDTYLDERLKQRELRPLGYEIAAHLAKHQYIDHFIVLNFDELLDEAVRDELPERVQFIAGPRDVLIHHSPEEHQPPCYVVHPFGLVSRRPYSVAMPDVTKTLGPEAVDDFLRTELPRPRFGTERQVYLLLLGYAAAEPAFERFLTSLTYVPGTGDPCQVVIYAVDIAETLPFLPTIERVESARRLARGHTDQYKLRVHAIRTDTDTAMELLLSLLEERSRKAGVPVWVPGARHKLIGNCFTHSELTRPDSRFRIELLLQGVKSRGFVHVEAFSAVRRLRHYGGPHVLGILNHLLERDVLRQDAFLGREQEILKDNKRYVPNYMIPQDDPASGAARTTVRRVLDALEQESSKAKDGTRVWECKPTKNRLEARQVPWRDYVEARLHEIERAPEIEVVEGDSQESQWMLGEDAKPLYSIQALSRATHTILEDALSMARAKSCVKIDGIWSTGEWLFHDDGWAAKLGLGEALLQEKYIALRVIITGEGGVRGERSDRRQSVLERLGKQHPASVKVYPINWWELNRVATLVQYPDAPQYDVAIYMKRRLARPTVSPYLVKGANAIAYLREVVESYVRRAELEIS